MNGLRGIWVASMMLAASFVVTGLVKADRFESSNFTIDASVSNSFGGATNSTSYKMVSSGGEAIIGNGTGGSYKIGQGYIAQLEKSLELRVQPASVEAHYPLDEGVGTRAHDKSVNSNQGRAYNGPVWSAGKIGESMTFDGTDDYIDAGDKPEFDVNAGEVQTVSVWMKAGVQASNRTILWKNSNCIGWALLLQSDGAVATQMNTGNNGCTGYTTHYLHSDSIVAGTNYDDDTWHHVVSVIDRVNGKLFLYVDNVKKGEMNLNTTDSGDGNASFRIATNYNNTTPFAGTVDEVKIINKALTAKEVKAEYDAQSAGVPSALTFATLDAATSQTVAAKAVIQTDAPGYTVSLSQDGNLTSGGNSIPAVTSGTIGTPAAWSEGTTKGLGFTLTGGNNIPVKWGTSPNFNYAAIPGTATSFYTRSGYTGGVKDILSMEYRVDIESSQAPGDYANTVTYTATVTP